VPLTLASGPRLPVGRSGFWKSVAARAAATVPARDRALVSALLLCGDTEALAAARDVAELVLRTVPGRLSLARGTGEVMLAAMALDFGHLNGAARAYGAALVEALGEALGEETDCRGR
jgi:hypothetical protein